MAAVPSNADLLRNYPATIPGATRNVIPDPAVPPGEEVVGLPLAIFRPVLNEQGVLADAVKVYVGPPLRDDGTTDGDYVSIALWLNGVQFEHRQIPEPERNDPTEFTLFQTSLLDNTNNHLYYKVYRLSGSSADSEPLWILYSAELPGGNNVPGNDEHPLLTVTLPPELGEPPFIGKDDVDAGVPLTLDYPYAKPYDVITVELRRQRFDFTVQPGDARPYVATITRALFEQAGGNHSAFAFSFTVVDQLNNPTDQRRWSAIITADVDLNRTMLDIPILRETLSDTTDDPTIIDRDKLQGRPLNVVVVPRPPLFAVGDTVEGRYISTPPDTMVPFSGTIETDDFGLFKPCVMTVANNRIISGNQVRVSYDLIRRSTPVGLSKTASAQVIGDGLINLRAPTVKQASGSVLNPIAARDKLTVVIPHYTGMDSAHRVFVTWTGTPSEGSHSSLPVDVGTVGEKDIEIPNSVVAFNLGKQVTVTYSVSINGGAPQASDPLTVNVQTIPDQSTDLPIPTIGGATGNELDVSRLDANSQLVVDPWPLQLSGQGVWLAYDGELASGGRETRIVWEGQPHSAASGLVVAAPVDWLKTLKDGSELIVTFKVNFDKVANAATAVRFRVRRYTVRAEPQLKLEFVNGPYVVSPAGRLKDIQIRMSTAADAPVANRDLTLTLPTGFRYADGGSGPRSFRTDSSGQVNVSAVRAPTTSGTHQLQATSDSLSATASLTVTARPALGVVRGLSGPAGMALSPDGLCIYVANSAANTVAVIDTQTLLVQRTLLAIDRPNHLALSPDGRKLYVAGGMFEGMSAVIDTETEQVTVLNNFYAQHGLGLNPDGTRLYGLPGDAIDVMDTATLERVATIPASPSGDGIAFSPDGTRAYAGGLVGNPWVIDTVQNRVLRRINLVGYCVTIKPDGSVIYFGRSGGIAVVDAQTFEVMSVSDYSSVSRRIVFNPNGSRAFVGHSYKLSVINAFTHRFLRTIPAQTNTWVVAISLDGSRVYTTDGNDALEAIDVEE